MLKTQILSTGFHVPERVVTNEELAGGGRLLGFGIEVDGRVEALVEIERILQRVREAQAHRALRHARRETARAGARGPSRT